MQITRRYRRYGTGWAPRRRTRIQTQRLLRAWIAGAAVLALALLLAAGLLFAPGTDRPRFEKGNLLICDNGDGSLSLYWPEAGASAYHLVLDCGEVHCDQYCARPSAQVSGVKTGERLRVQIRAEADGKSLLGKPRQVNSWRTLKADVVLEAAPPAPEVSGAAGTLRWTGEGETYEIFRIEEAAGRRVSVPAASTEASALSLEDGRFTVRAGRRAGRDAVLCGPASAPVNAGGPELPEGPLALSFEETAPRIYTLGWNGSPCDYFEVQELQGETWRTLARLAPEERMRWDTGRLRSGSFHRYRVTAGGGESAAEEVSFYASVSTLYSTVWPIQDLTLREEPGSGGTLGKVPAGTALCVLAEEGDWFRVRYGEEYGWLDSRFCMIDLPEYIGDFCDYDITNSYQSLFAAHNADIRGITGEVIAGFENIRTAEGGFLVPYLYPCAKKLLTAAQNARADGYQLKIYEAFRPQRATRFLYDTAEKQMSDTAQTESGGRTTLFRLMTDNGRFSLGSFLARSISAHNRGIALDLTLEKLDGGQELAMQSEMHDLSWYAATDRSNVNAKLLASYMTGVGMNGLSSEWWHFQDDATRSAIGLNASLYEGVSAEGWTQDDGGWRYRKADGSFLRAVEATIDGRTCTFDAEGYSSFS